MPFTVISACVEIDVAVSSVAQGLLLSSTRQDPHHYPQGVMWVFFIGGLRRVQIFKVFNNNAVASITDDGQDVILTGAGIGFQKHTGDAVEENAIEKRYYFHDGESDSIYGLFAHTPVEFFNISKSIMDEAEKRLHIVLKDQVLIALTDHIVFAVERARNGEGFSNLMFSEVCGLYRREYEIGLWGIHLVEETLGIRLPEDEASFIALHILNGQSDLSATAVLDTIHLVSGCIQVIEELYGITFDTDELSYIRLTTHLKFLAQRIFSGTTDEDGFFDQQMFDLLCERNPLAHECARKISAFLKSDFSYSLSDREEFYLMIHVLKTIG